MADAVESRIDMRAATGEIEAFHYAESPWVEHSLGAADPLATASPDTAGFDRHSNSTLYETYSFNPQVSRELVPERYSYRVEPGFACDDVAGDSIIETVSAEPSYDPARELEQQQLFQQLLASENRKADERGHGKGMEIGLALGREEANRQFQGERERLAAQVAALVESFSSTRESYFHQLEKEVVKLALAISARILRREAQADPLLLTGSVRAALGQLAASTTVRLLVPAEDQPMWEEAMARMPGLAPRPQVIADPRMELGDGRMETELGSADLGLWPQLKAIERTFFDRPGNQGQNPGRDRHVAAGSGEESGNGN